MLYYVTISVYKFCVLGVQGPSCGLAAVLHSDYHGDERATTGGKYLNITSLGNKVRCRFSAWICSYCAVFVYPGESPALSFHRTIHPHYDGASPKMRLGKQSERDRDRDSTKYESTWQGMHTYVGSRWLEEQIDDHLLQLQRCQTYSVHIDSCLGSQLEIV